MNVVSAFKSLHESSRIVNVLHSLKSSNRNDQLEIFFIIRVSSANTNGAFVLLIGGNRFLFFTRTHTHTHTLKHNIGN